MTVAQFVVIESHAFVYRGCLLGVGQRPSAARGGFGSGPRWSSLQPEEDDEMDTTGTVVRRAPWNKGKLVGQKAPLKVKDIRAIRVRLQIQVRVRELAPFDLGIHS
jgi:hypothetical protein